MEHAPSLSLKLKELPIINDLVKACKLMSKGGHATHMASVNPYINRESPHSCSSVVMSSGEVTALTILIEYISCSTLNILPVNLEHDGVMIMSDLNVKEEDVKGFCDGFKNFLYSKVGIRMSLEMKSV